MNKAKRAESKINTGSHWESNTGPLSSATIALTTKVDNHQNFTVYQNFFTFLFQPYSYNLAFV